MQKSMKSALQYLTKQFGAKITYNQIVQGEYNPATGTVENTTNTTLAYGYVRKARSDEYNDLVQRGDIIVVISDPIFQVSPQARDVMVIDGVSYYVTDIEKIYVTGGTIGYKLIGSVS